MLFGTPNLPCVATTPRTPPSKKASSSEGLLTPFCSLHVVKLFKISAWCEDCMAVAMQLNANFLPTGLESKRTVGFGRLALLPIFCGNRDQLLAFNRFAVQETILAPYWGGWGRIGLDTTLALHLKLFILCVHDWKCVARNERRSGVPLHGHTCVEMIILTTVMTNNQTWNSWHIKLCNNNNHNNNVRCSK